MPKLHISKSMIIQILLVIALVGMWIPDLFSRKIYSQAEMETVSAALVKNLDAAVYEAKDNQKIKRYLSLDPGMFESIAFWRSDDAMSAQELVIAKSDDPAVLEAFAAAMEERQESQYNIYEGYAPAQAAMVEQGIIDVQGNYAMYYVGDNPAQMETLFVKALS